MKGNRLRDLLNEGKPTLGTHIISPWPGIVEVIGHSGAFDYVEYTGEYSPFSLEQMDNFGRAIELFPTMSSMMKVEEHGREFIAGRAICAGIQNILFASCRSADDVKECMRLVRPETPEARGLRGCTMSRNLAYGLWVGSDEWIAAMNDTVVAIMLEKSVALDDLKAILSVKGVDMVQFGPADYSISIGKSFQPGSAELQQKEREIVEMSLEMGVAPRVELHSLEQAKPFFDMGVRHFCIGWDVMVMTNWCKQQADAWKNLRDMG
ncbi:MAG: 2,4-dihydroxyhept-2-ene-1,7-dioic acid aldolase [Dehalococcoidia bacterium]|nr:2,4-dihydroxyhept-2-ene-1,7-dioic acid aldolase [Dehalococcoidia bacterium]